MTHIRPFSPTPMDLALVRRLAAQQFLMDTTIALTREVNPLEAALLTVVPLADLGFPTLILRDAEIGYIGQLRHRNGETHAHLASLAPAPQRDTSQTLWLQLVEAMVTAAGRRGALTLVAEIPERAEAAFEILRKAGFVVYTRQTIYRRIPARIAATRALKRVQLRPASDQDMLRLPVLYANLVPSLVQQADPLPDDLPGGLVVETIDEQRLVGHLAIIEGKSGLMVKPLLHPDLFDDATEIIGSALQFWPKAERLPLFFCIRSYQEWLSAALENLEMESSERQALFVKHTVVHAGLAGERVRTSAETVVGTLVSNCK